MTWDVFDRNLPVGADFLPWYDELVASAQLADHGPVTGTMVIRPYGYAIWEAIRRELELRIKACGVDNAYFPLFIPQHYLSRVEELEGLESELAVVTHAAGSRLTDPAVVRFSSETVIGEFLGKWIQSYRDLPLRLNQWANVVRWEENPSLFMRTNEFLWQEGHTVHTSRDEAREFARRVQTEIYQDLMENVIALPVVAGIKSRRERSGGPELNTFTCESMTGDGRALQLGTSVEGGQVFAKAFGIQYLDQDGGREYPWTTSWGASTRLIGGLIMGHGDADGLRLPPLMAPQQVVVLWDTPAAAKPARDLVARLREAGLRATADERVDLALSARTAQWKVKGVPVRVHVAVRPDGSATATLSLRLAGQADVEIPIEQSTSHLVALMEIEQTAMLAHARQDRDARISECDTVTHAREAAWHGWAKLPWDRVRGKGENELAVDGVTVRCLQRADGTVPDHDDEPDLVAFVARSY